MKIRKLLVLTGSVIVMALGAFSIKAQAAPVKQADGNYFDAAFYAQQNPDVVAVFGNKSDMLYAHYVYFGKAEGRLPYSPSYNPSGSNLAVSSFDPAYYAGKYPDVAIALGYDPSLLKLHFDLYGQYEGRYPNAAAESAATGNAITGNNGTMFVVNTGDDSSSVEKQVLNLVNAYRAQYGLSALTWDSTNLAPGAALRAQEISLVFSHTRPDGTSCFTAIRNPGYVGENIAAGQRTPEAVMNSWMNSAGHRANILNPSFRKIGVGYFSTSSGYGSYWVQMFSS